MANAEALEIQPDADIDTVAAYWNRRPCNIRHSTKAIGTAAYFDEVEQRKYMVEPHIPGFADFARWKGKRVLEIGCGIGTDATNFARAGADYTAIDLSDESIALAKKRFEVFGLSGRFFSGNSEQLSKIVPDGDFDLIYSFGVIHHTPAPVAVIKEARKLIAADGEFRLMLYARHSWKDIMIDAGLDQPEAQTGCPIAFRYTHDEVRDLLAEGGFSVTSIEQTHIFPYKIESYVKYEYELQPWFKAMPGEMFEALERRMGWHLLITARPA
jgi:SAM-dependent methyltransferase